MYREEILDHYKRPRNTGKIETKYESEGENKSCGDKVKIYLEIENNTIQDIKHQTEGCAICTAATSIISQKIPGKDKEEVQSLDKDWLINKIDIDISPARVKCAVLGLKTLQRAAQK
jgi:nitrogen fixation NifU-like protein